MQLRPTWLQTEVAGLIPELVLAEAPILWANPRQAPAARVLPALEMTLAQVHDAELRWRRFGPLLAKLFLETAPAGGHINSPLLELDDPASVILTADHSTVVLVKADHLLPVTGSIKARGGVYEVLAFAERLAIDHSLLADGENAVGLDRPEARALFSNCRIVVGSTGNLGYSVGVISRALGFGAEVHMSSDAKVWKKERLSNIGVNVVEHPGDYASAVAAARREAAADPAAYFVDDENSIWLFLGYAVAAKDLKVQLDRRGIKVDASHPLFVYLPCGVGGAPGGITFGLKALFGDAVRCIFVEPTGAPCMLVQLAVGVERQAVLADIGLSGSTVADGLAVSGASMLVARTVGRLVDACATVSDDELLDSVRRCWDGAGLRLEPSAAAGFCAASALLSDTSPLGHAARHQNAVHVVWTTGGSHLPDEEFEGLLAPRAR